MVEHSEPSAPRTRSGPALRRRDVIGLGAILAVTGVVLALVIPGGSGVKGPAGTVAAKLSVYAGLAVTPTKTAPPLLLRNYLGTPVNIASYRGKAVLVTFLYTHCPDVCPLIASHLHTALTQMSTAERARLQIIAVSVDPRGDTPSTVAQFLHDHEMTGGMQYLIGSARQLAATWAAWGIATSPGGTSNPELVAHSALIYGISGHGRITVIYPASFQPSDIVHDASLLARA